MAYDGWIDFADGELINLSRTAQLAEVLGIDVLWITPEDVAWIQDALGGSDYDDIAEAPWYDPGFPASAEFAGFVPLSFAGLDDSTRESATVEYITSGGTSNKPRNKTLALPVNLAVVASTDRGADFGKRWLDRRLSGRSAGALCSGAKLEYFRYPQQAGEPTPPRAHRRDVVLTRGTSVTRKRSTDCASLWWVTFTLTANDPFEYGTELAQFSALGGVPVGPGVASYGQVDLVQASCPVYEYTPIYDPLYPALVAPPSVPDFYPAGWNIADGMAFRRFWVRLNPTEPSSLNLVPIITLTTDTDARRVRVSVWPGDESTSAQCSPLFSIIDTYLPPDIFFVIDGEQQASYVWDGVSDLVRRADSLVYGPEAVPVAWDAFNDPSGLLVALDVFVLGGGYEGGGTIRATLDLVPKSD